MKVRLLELFSGVGGMHFGALLSGLDVELAAAVDISDVANDVYRHNFPAANHLARNICGLSAADMDRWAPQAIFMSPPCQPFTRVGLRRDLEDSRTEPLIKIIQLLPHIASLKYVLVENVKGFESSAARDRLSSTLRDAGFATQEFLISPTSFGIPNSRLRYYLIAKRNEAFAFETRDELWTDPQPLKRWFCCDTPQSSSGEDPEKRMKVGDYLEDGDATKLDEFGVSSKTLMKHAEILDIVSPNSETSCCFTKSYGRYAEGTGSVLQRAGDVSSAFARARLASTPVAVVDALQELRLRYFTPNEVAKLMGFPSSFAFPEKVTRQQRYRVLGNSVNVHVIAFLIHLLTDTKRN